jgi:hypothetical protein
MKTQIWKSPVFWLKIPAVFALIIVTLGLAGVNTWGAWIATGGGHSTDGNIFYTAAVFGVEVFGAVALALLLSSPTEARKAAGVIVFLGMLYVCVENGKVGIKTALADVFTGDPNVIEQQADLTLLEADAAKERAKQYRAQAITRSTATIDLYKSNVVTATQAVEEKAEEWEARAVEEEERELNARREVIQLRAEAELIKRKEVWLWTILGVLEGLRSLGLWAFILWTPKHSEEISVDADEYEQAKAALDEKKRRSESLRKTNEQKKREEFIRKQGITDVSWASAFMDNVSDAVEEGKVGKQIAEKMGMTFPEFEAQVKRLFRNERDLKAILGGDYAAG